ncbi:unnamed protein product [Penicillium palitans]
MSLQSFDMNDDAYDIASDIDGMIQVASDEHSATSLILANLVARRMREFQENDEDFTGSGTAPTDLLSSLSSNNTDEVSHEFLRSIAYSMDLTTMPEDLLLLVLPMLLHVDTNLPTPEDLHALHEFAEASPMHRGHVETWLRSEPAQSTLEQVFKPWMNYYSFKPAYQCRDEIAAYRASRGGFGFNYANYDQNGRSFLHAAIEGEDAESVMFIVAILLKGNLDPRHFPTSIDGMSIPHHVALMHDNDVFRGVIEFLEDAGYPLSVWNDDGLKLELCSFITADMAERLLSKGFNITKLPRNTLPMYLPDEDNPEYDSGEEWNRDAGYGDPIIRGEDFDPENDKLDPKSIPYDAIGVNPIELHPTSRTIWHRAIENPQGPRILDWLLDHSYTQPGCRTDFDRDTGETALVAGARGGEPAGIDWFCQHCDPMAGRVRSSQDTEGDETAGAYALQVAAHNLRPHCDVIFKRLLRHVDHKFYWDVSMIKGLYWLIIKNYRDMYQRLEDHKEPGRERAQRMALLRSLTSAKTRALNNRLEPFWDRWGSSEQRNWLIQYCTILRLNFLVKDLSSDVWDDSD